MSFVTLKNEFSEDLLACRACLATDRKLYSIYRDDIILNAYKNLIGSQVSTYDGLPQYICNYCCILLLKYNEFRDVCRRASQYLEDARKSNTFITPEYLSKFKSKENYKKTNVINFNINDNCRQDDTNYIYDRSNNDYLIDNESIKIFTHNVKIKKETNTPIQDTETQNEITKINNVTIKRIKKNSKHFETQENMSNFEKSFNVQVVILSREQQLKDMQIRKSSSNYLLSPYKCELCYRGYVSENMLKKHTKAQHDKSRGDNVCEICKFRYKDRRGLNHHLKTHRQKFICKQCSYVSKTTFNAKEHFKVHGGQIHRCSHCGKSHEKLSSHLSHVRIHHPSALVWCQICAQACIGLFGLNAHKKKSHRHFPLPVACASCDARFVDSAALSHHSARDTCSAHACVHCGDGFDDAQALRAHLLEHKIRQVYKCEKCDKTFSRENLYSAHYKRIHVDNADKATKIKDKPWICEVCGKSLPNKCLLLYHQRNHTGERPYRCSLCPKTFTMRKLLQSHSRVHTNDRPYVCKLCPKTFKGLSALRGHEYIHTGETKLNLKNKGIK